MYRVEPVECPDVDIKSYAAFWRVTPDGKPEIGDVLEAADKLLRRAVCYGPEDACVKALQKPLGECMTMLTDTDSIAPVTTDVPRYRLFVRQMPEIEQWTDFDTKESKISFHTRFACVPLESDA